jgi:anhydro-N-acetylmuramic acid kinase
LHPHFAATHGHTVFHRPWQQTTSQLGCGETICSHVELPVVANFRVRDVALGGEGAPMVPLAEWHLFPQEGAFLNLGGIANISLFQDRLPGAVFAGNTWLKPGKSLLTYDLAACNLVLNRLAARYDARLAYDPEGTLAAAGQLLPELLAQLNALPFYAQVPPRSLGLEQLEADVFPLLDVQGASIPDVLHTWCHHLVQVIVQQLAHLSIGNAGLRVTGGGAHNTFLMTLLQDALASRGIHILDSSTQLIDFKEALMFGFLGLMRLLGQPTVLLGATGSRVAASTGSLHLPTGTGLWQL